MPIEFVRERSFENRGLRFAAKEWGRSGSLPVIALHGWLDNANTFDRMLPHMENLHVIALDLAGHGRSDFRSADSGYEIWHDISDIMAVADAMGWERFALLGHSRGAVISGLVAGTYPERISHVALIDGFIPMPADAQGTAQHLAKALHEYRRYGSSSPTLFRDYESAVRGRINGFLPLQYEAAVTLAERGVVETEQGFFWRNDQRLKAASHVKLSKDHLQSFFTAISAQVLLIQAENSQFKPDRQQTEVFSWIPQMQIHKVPGSHHLHLEEAAQTVAEKVQSVFG
jgi:pimeloyl-ACP methyl ester carboxylesterase